MIKSFKDKQAAAVFQGLFARKLPPEIQQKARDKMIAIDTAPTLDALAAPPSNNLEQLKGGRKGQHSIRVNKQWRICFKWAGSDAHDVEIVDYH